jgi:hypothetical protein
VLYGAGDETRLCVGPDRLADEGVADGVVSCSPPQEKSDFEWAMKMMNPEKIQEMREQDALRAKMQFAYKVRQKGRNRLPHRAFCWATSAANPLARQALLRRELWMRVSRILLVLFPSSSRADSVRRGGVVQAGDYETVKKIEYALLPEEEKLKLKRN